MKTDAVAKTLLFDYYGELLTEKQKSCFDLYYNQDFSLAEIAEESGISRQGVYDTLARAEAYLENLEEKIGCIARAGAQQKALSQIRHAAAQLEALGDPAVSELAATILAAANTLKE